MLSLLFRLCFLNKGLLTHRRGLARGSLYKVQEPLDIREVRNKLGEIVGVSTNWRDHIKAMEERKLLDNFLVKSQKDLPPRKMKDSYIEVLLPLGSDPSLREKYLTVQNTVRFGRILEDLDSLGGSKNFTVWFITAIFVHIDNEFWPVLDATFVMVARDSENKGPAFVNPLIPENEEEEELFRQGELNKSRRIAWSSASLLKVAPSPEERNTIHELFLSTLDPKTISFQSRVLPAKSVWMEDTKLKSLDICHPQERNIFNRIFGGFLMRKAYELGWTTACSFGGSRPFVVTVDDIMFQKPVEVGSLLFLSSQVCFTQNNYIQVRVHSEVASLQTNEHMTTNIFHFTFMSEKEVPSVFPKTYGESMLYLDGQRHFKSMSVPLILKKDYPVEP
ncbi:acyl-coenzyme A thioesterase 9, mitochondrial [Meriones unguiculatus]|uniref:acyl-coenzyme A thioesterase 9, mitochondrial n=1 Tax=Meriones unguiculatus TaxID=10047 RepID=UPI00293E810E|nr:acyl-coenzyme A thioesterase 9, mitochondrial [Meriones unguiculatus]